MSIEVNATEQIIEVNATGSTIDINVSSQTVDVNATTSVIEVTASYNPGINLPIGGATGQVLKKQSGTDYDTYWGNDNGVPYIGATGDVDLGEYELKAGQIELDQSPTGTAGVAVTRWNDAIGSTETTLKGGNVILKNGVDLIARVVNKVTPNTTLTKAAYQAVKISGAQGQRLAVALAQANNDNNSADTLGLVTETIPTNQEGFIMTVGNLEGINTTGSLQGETWSDGDVLYLSPTTAGAITNIKPNGSTGHIVVIGYVEYAHANNGKIYVKIMNGWELDELHNVFISSPANNDALIYESATSLWKNKSIATALGYTPGTVSSVALTVPTGLVVTSGSPITTSGTIAVGLQSGYSIPTTVKQGNWDDAYTFVSAFPSQTGNSGKYLTTDGSTLSWGTVSTANIYNSDGTLTGNRVVTNNAFTLTIRNTSASAPLILQNTQAYGTGGVFTQYAQQWLSSTGTSAGFVLGDIGRLVMTNMVQAPQFFVGSLAGIIDAGVARGGSIGINGAPIDFGTATHSGGGQNIGRWFGTGNLVIQTGGTFTDAGYKLDVQGTGRFTGGLTGTTANFSGNAAFGATNQIGIGGSGGFGGGANYWLEAVSQNLTLNAIAAIEFLGASSPLNSYTGRNSAISQRVVTNNYTAGIDSYYNQYKAVLNATGNAFANTMYVRGFFVDSGTLTANSSTLIPIGFENVSGTNLFNSTSGSTLFGGQYSSLNVSAQVQINSTTRGFLQPRMTTTQRDAIVSPATGLSVYNTTTNTSDFYNGTSWVSLAAGNIYTADGTLTGNRTITSGGFNLTFTGSNTAASAIARGLNLTHTLVAAANNDVLVGLDVRPTFTNGAFTGVENINLRLGGAGNRSMKLIAGDGSGNAYITNDISSQITYTAGYGGHIFKFNDGTNSSTPLSISHNLVTGSGSLGNSTNRWQNLFSLNVSSDTYQIQGTNIIAFSYYAVNTGLYLDLTNKYLSLFTNGSEKARLTSAGRLLLGTTTESTYLLDVNGTARIKATASNDTGQFIITDQTTSNNLFRFTGNSKLFIGTASFPSVIQSFGTNNNLLASYNYLDGATDNTGTFGAFNIGSIGNISNMSLSATYYNNLYLKSTITTSYNSAVINEAVIGTVINGTSTGVMRGLFINPTITSGGTGWLAIQSTSGGAYFNTSSVSASAILQADSTTKGFLPPRMTSAQRSAIGTPSVGLIVYQTDGTEGLYENTSTGWRILYNTPSGGSGITRSVNNISTTTTAGAAANTDYVYLISGTTTLTLPTAAGNTNRYTLKNVGTNTVTINTTSSQTIDGSTSITMAVRYTALDVISDGTNWNII